MMPASIRAMGQQAGIDIFGANCLGVADSWNQARIWVHWVATVRQTPSSAARSRSSPTRAASPPPSRNTCVWPAGDRPPWCRAERTFTSITRLRSSLLRQHGTRAAGPRFYCEPGGYYERDADFTKPVVACVVGRWRAS